jgi:hypothetical protein
MRITDPGIQGETPTAYSVRISHRGGRATPLSQDNSTSEISETA